MPGLTWKQVLDRKDLIGGDIESIEDGVAYRGPLAEIKQDGEMIRFTSPWCARRNPETGEWENWHITASAVNLSVPPQDIGDGRVFFSMPYLGACTIFPKGGSKLDTGKVKGLPKASERFLKLFPGLRFDRKLAEQVLAEQAFERTLHECLALPLSANLTDVIACFRHDSQAEEFLWHYVEAATSEKNVHQRVY